MKYFLLWMILFPLLEVVDIIFYKYCLKYTKGEIKETIEEAAVGFIILYLLVGFLIYIKI